MSSTFPEPRQVPLPTPDQLAVARRAITARMPRSPTVLAYEGWHLKLDSLLPTGSFKLRGAIAAVDAAPDPGSTLVTASAGNHAAALAHRARATGRRCIAFVPADASPRKLARLRVLGADVRIHDGDFDATERAAIEHADALADTRYVSAYNDTWVIAGQASVGFEVLEDLDGPLTVVVPVGGGGLLTGVVLAARTTSRDVRVVAVEAANSATLTAHRAGAGTGTEHLPTVADAVAGGIEPGAPLFRIVDDLHDVVTVSEPEIRAAMRHLATEHGLVVEGAGALAVAAVRNGAVDPSSPVVSLVTGSNVADDVLARVLTEST